MDDPGQPVDLSEILRATALAGPRCIVVTISLADLGGGEAARDVEIEHDPELPVDWQWLANQLHVAALDISETAAEWENDDGPPPENVRRLEVP